MQETSALLKAQFVFTQSVKSLETTEPLHLNSFYMNGVKQLTSD